MIRPKRPRRRFSRQVARDTSKQLFRPHVDSLEGRLLLSVYTVTNVNDSGSGSLRQAILDANANPGLDTIRFNIIGGGVHTIVPSSALPAITDPAILDATTQPGYAGTPVIELNGAAVGAGGVGLFITAGNSEVKGFAINRFASRGILLQTVGGNTIVGNLIGTDPSGTAALPNGLGIHVFASNSNRIGGSGPDRNVISGNTGAGLTLDSGSSGNVVQGNLIGTNLAGTAALANGFGIGITNSPGNMIGGSGPGVGNVISGNGSGTAGDGISIYNGSTSNVVAGNLIGTNASGTAALGNAGSGVGVSAPGNTIGGPTNTPHNIIAGNRNYGIGLIAGANNTTIMGNFIGTDITGTVALGNAFAGVGINGVTGNTVSANLISGNTNYGVVLFGLGTSSNQVVGNFVGVAINFSTPLANSGYGVGLTSGATGNTIGGDTGSDGNIISGNTAGGVAIFGAGTNANAVQGNLVGTDLSGTAAVPNASGVAIFQGAANNLVGGADTNARNIISGNLGDGVQIAGAGTTGNLLEGNFIGSSEHGSAALPNQNHGVDILQNASGNTVGGSDAGAGNLISGNGGLGVAIGSGANGNTVAANLIGIDASGSTAIGNGIGGLLITQASTNNLVSGNVISGNSNYGIFVSSSDSNAITGDLIGTTGDGGSALPNDVGIILDNSNGITITGDVVSGNAGDGIFIASGQNDVIESNLIGTAADGSTPLGNGNNGVTVQSTDAAFIQIGSEDIGAGNVIAYNANDGVFVFASFDVAILGNSIFGSGNLGIELSAGANNDQAAPVLTNVTSDGTTITVEGTLTSAADSNFTLEFFSDAECNPSGFGEGQTFLGSIMVTTDDGGNAVFSASFSLVASDEQFVAATATDGSGDTSAFSACVPVSGTGPAPIGGQFGHGRHHDAAELAIF